MSEKHQPSPVPFRPLRILLVDDDPETVLLFESVFAQGPPSSQAAEDEETQIILPRTCSLSSPGSFDLWICQSGKQALNVLQTASAEDAPFSVVFIETSLNSGEDGIEIAEQVRELDPYLNLVVVTESRELKIKDLAWRIGPMDKLLFVMKPLIDEEILQFASALAAKWNVEAQLRRICSQLQSRIEERTDELTHLNEQLRHKISEHKMVEDALRTSERFMKNVFDAIQDGIAVLDKDMNILRANRTLEKWYSFNLPFQGKKCYEVLHGRSRRCEECPSFQMLEEDTLHKAAVPMKTPHGETRWYEIFLFPLFDGKGHMAGAVEYLRDISERVRAEEKLLHDAFHDKLTGLPNKALFMDRLQQAVRRTQRNNEFMFSVLLVDLDRFKILNDSLGHNAGDKLLIDISERVKICVRTGDTVARFGGDEFIILLDGIKSVSDATRVAERLHEEMSKPFLVGNHEVFTSASIGITLSASHYEEPEEFIRDADTAMFRAKALGRGRHQIFDSDMHSNALKQLQIENDLRRAVENNEFCLHYQPIISLESGRIVGLEALLRWNHPEGRLVPPAEFIPIAEETGLILPMGAWVLEESCRQMRQWQERIEGNSNLWMSVNISGKQFSQSNLCEHVSQALRKSSLDPKCLRLEMTEGEVMEHAETAVIRLSQLRELDIEIYIDDFGTGYSSLSYLHRFPIDALKVDKSFVSGSDAGPESLEIIRTIVMLARYLEIAIVVEGIETEQQLQRIRSMQCDYAQGFYFSRPLSKDKLEQFIRTQPVW